MNKAIEIQELAIAIAAKNLNPSVLSLEFLQYTGVIPADYELARPPAYSNGLVQLLFKNGLGIIAQPNRIILAEAIAAKNREEIQVAQIASQLVNKLSQLEYQGVGINPRGFITFDTEAAAEKYISSNLLSPGTWQEFGEGKMSAALQLNYPLQQGQLNLNINPANIQFPEKTVPAILFSGNFNYSLSEDSASERSQSLQKRLADWQQYLTTFQKILVEKFLPLADQPTNISIISPTLIS